MNFFSKLAFVSLCFLVTLPCRASDFKQRMSGDLFFEGNPLFLDGKDYYQVLGIARNASKQEIKEAYDKIQQVLAQRLQTSRALSVDARATQKLKTQIDKSLNEIDFLYYVLSDEDQRKKYDMALLVHNRATAQYVKNKLSKPIIEHAQKASKNLDWKVELTNNTGEYLYCILYDSETGKEIAPLKRRNSLLELTPIGTKENSARINNIQLPSHVRLEIYTGSSVPQEAHLISSHTIAIGANEKLYLEIFNGGATVFPYPAGKATRSGLSTKNNISVENITRIKQ